MRRPLHADNDIGMVKGEQWIERSVRLQVSELADVIQAAALVRYAQQPLLVTR